MSIGYRHICGGKMNRQNRSLGQKENQKRTYKIKKDWEINEKLNSNSGHKIRRRKLCQTGDRTQRLVRMCCVLAGLCCLLAVPSLAQTPEKNGYIADKPLETYIHDTVKGDLIYTVGNSYYSGKLYPGKIYTVTHNVDLPEGATVKFARLYDYWTWSAEGVTGRYPEMKLSLNGNVLTPEKEYSDRKGWGIYDYPTGTWAYNVSAFVNSSGTFKTDIENTGPAASFVCIDGVGLLIVYTNPDGKDVEYWINEGSDELNSQMDENGKPLYYATPNETICEMIKPTLQSPVRSATLWTIAQSGNWMNNTLLANGEKFPGINEGKPYPDLDVNVSDITDSLKPGENSILFQAVGDYVVPSGAFLVIEKDPLAEKTQASTDDISKTSEDADKTAGTSGSESKKTPGFEFGFAFVLLIGGKLVNGYIKKKARK